MKEIIYGIYAFLFNISSSLFKIKKNRVALVSMHNENFKDSLGGIYEELKKDAQEYEFVFISKQDLEIKAKNVFRVISFFLLKSRKLATSKYVFLNDNFLPMSKMNFKKEAVITQLWHGDGVFKKFGFAINQNEKLRQSEREANKRLSYVVCSSKSVVPFYAEAFAVEEERVLPLGSARTDFFFSEKNKKEAKERLCLLYPSLKGKKLVLYAPTFRDTKEENAAILRHFDIDFFCKEMGEEYALLIRLHPQIHESVNIGSQAVDVTDYDDVRQLVLSCDALVTDYSSICMDFSLLEKKTVFFCYDKEKYIKDRDFYFPYDSYIPGEAALTMKEVTDSLKLELDKEKNEKFKNFNFDCADGKSAQRIIEYIIKR